MRGHKIVTGDNVTVI